MYREARPPSIVIRQSSRVGELRQFWEEKSPSSAGSTISYNTIILYIVPGSIR